MKKLIPSVLSLIIISIGTQAQTAPAGANQYTKIPGKGQAFNHHHRKGMHGQHHFMQQLNLSDQQKQQAKTYHEEYSKQLRKLSKNETITVKEQRDRKMALRKEEKAKMQSLLTPGQKDKLAQLKAAGKARAEQHYAARMERLKTKLNMTDQQVAQVKAQREGMIAKCKAIKEDDSMDRSAKKEKLIALRAQMTEDRKKIFTPTQLQQIEEMKKERIEKKTVK